MDEFHTRLTGSLVAHSRYIAAQFDTLGLDILEGLLRCGMPIGGYTSEAWATKQQAHFAVLLPKIMVYAAFEWELLEEYNGRRIAIALLLVAHSHLFLFGYFADFIPNGLFLYRR